MTVNAPAVEQRLQRIVRRYEQVKLILLSIVLVLDLGIGVNLIFLARDNRESLHILRCAVSTVVNNKPDPAARQKAFLECAHGKTKVPA